MLRQDTGMSCTQSNHGRGRGAREENGIPKKRKTLGDVMEQNGCNAERMKKWADLLYPMFVTSGVRLSSGGEHDNVASMRDFTGWHPGDSRKFFFGEMSIVKFVELLRGGRFFPGLHDFRSCFV